MSSRKARRKEEKEKPAHSPKWIWWRQPFKLWQKGKHSIWPFGSDEATTVQKREGWEFSRSGPRPFNEEPWSQVSLRSHANRFSTTLGSGGGGGPRPVLLLHKINDSWGLRNTTATTWRLQRCSSMSFQKTYIVDSHWVGFSFTKWLVHQLICYD